MENMNVFEKFINSHWVVYGKAPADSRFYATGCDGSYKVNQIYQSRYDSIEKACGIAQELAECNPGWEFQVRELHGSNQKKLATYGKHDPALAVSFESEKEREKKRKEEERAEKLKKYHYFGEEMSAAHFARACNQLEKKLRYNDAENGIVGILTNAEFVEKALENGYEAKTHRIYGKGKNALTYKEGYIISKNGMGYKVNKTVYDYAVFLRDMKHPFREI